MNRLEGQAEGVVQGSSGWLMLLGGGNLTPTEKPRTEVTDFGMRSLVGAGHPGTEHQEDAPGGVRGRRVGCLRPQAWLRESHTQRQATEGAHPPMGGRLAGWPTFQRLCPVAASKC